MEKQEQYKMVNASMVYQFNKMAVEPMWVSF